MFLNFSREQQHQIGEHLDDLFPPTGLPVGSILENKETGHAGGRAALCWARIWLCWARWLGWARDLAVLGAPGLGMGFGWWAAGMRPEIATQPITDEQLMHGGATAGNEVDPSSNELQYIHPSVGSSTDIEHSVKS